MIRRLFLGLLALLPLLAAGLWINWALSTPSHDRPWQPLYSRLPQVEIMPDRYVFRDIRNWSYAENGAGTPNWIDATLVPSELTNVWFIVEPFGENEAVAHTMLAFEFADGAAYVASVEARREIDESYGGLKAGILPMHEYMFVWTTERDMYANSTYMARDDLHLYRLELPEGGEQAVLQAMVQETAELMAEPRWYNTFFSNCTNVLARAMNRHVEGAVPWDLSWHLPGYSVDFLVDQGFVDDRGDLEVLKATSLITPFVPTAYAEVEPKEFSKALRQVMANR